MNSDLIFRNIGRQWRPGLWGRISPASTNRIARKTVVLLLLAAAGYWLPASNAGQPVAISEIMYHPVEEPAFNADGTPVLDLTQDVHEFVEIVNYGSQPIPLGGWSLAGGIHYTFPVGAWINPGEYRVVARDMARLAAVKEYGLSAASLFGPYAGGLGNAGDKVVLRDGQGQTVDAVNYSAGFPWPIAADGLGAGEAWTRLRHADYQYRGRSLERVSFQTSGHDPANWLASPLATGPSPGRPNATHRELPLPVVVELSATQSQDGQTTIRAGQAVRLQAGFSATNELGAVQVEYFLDDPNATNEPTALMAMSAAGNPAEGRFTATMPGQADRGVVRYRIQAERAGHWEVVSPRADDPFAWHAYFVSPVRTTTYPAYDLFISTASLNTLATNISQNPRRVTSPDPPGYPRASWDATEPAIFVADGIVHDIQVRYHGSRYNRSPGKQSYKFFFPRYRLHQGQQTLLVTEKGNDNVAAYGLFRAAGLPASVTRWVDLYVNNNGRLTRLQLEDYTEEMLKRYHGEQAALNPGAPEEKPGELYKSMGVIDPPAGEGPYGRGDGSLLPARLPYWTPLARYEWTYPIQDHDWKGGTFFQNLIEGMWQARGDTSTATNPKVPALRAFFLEHFDVDKMLTYHAVLNWMCPWDDTTQNHFFWQQANGLWTMLPWDMDAMFGDAGASIFAGEVGDRSNNFRGPNFFKDSFIKAFRQELKERNFLLVNTLLHPDNLAALGYGSYRSFATSRQSSVMSQCGLGTFQRPVKPVNQWPLNGATALPPSELRASGYLHSTNPAPAHTSTTWEIRSANGSYAAPVFRLESTNWLISLPVPFAQLRFGETYYWRCTYQDTNRHPSLVSDETAFAFGLVSRPQTNVVSLAAIDANTTWKYNQTATDLDANWRQAAYDDRAWPSGPALFAVETAALPESIRTPLKLGQLTYYFRTHFTFSGNTASALLRMNVVLDDGAVFYLNGQEFHRLRLPAQAVSYSTLASSSVGDAVYEGPITVATTNLVAGDNVLAVEVHQSSASSSDIVFGLALEEMRITTAGGSEVVLNEIAACNRTPQPGNPSLADWVELHNSGSQSVDITGWSLSDDVFTPQKYLFPPGTTLPPHAGLMVWCDRILTNPGLHTGFGLKAEGETVLLFSPGAAGPVLKDAVQYGMQAPDLSIGRVPDGSGAWQLAHPTPGLANEAQPVGPAGPLKINEWMASPVTGDDWLELFNPQALPVPLTGLTLAGQGPVAGAPIAPLSFISARGFTTFFASQSDGMEADHTPFKLSASGETIWLLDTNLAVIDRVAYAAQSPGISQGRWPDGAPQILAFPGSPSPGAANKLAGNDEVKIGQGQWLEGAFVLTFEVPANQAWQVEFTESLSGPQWVVLANFAAEASHRSLALTNRLPEMPRERYYRLRATGIGP